jgi:F0F1-type ATP synthase assembly protein I
MMYNNAGTGSTMANDSENGQAAGSSRPKQSDAKQSDTKQSDTMKSLVQVESLIQLALMLPIATVIGWLIGAGLDKWLHQHWIYIPGLILGAAAGFVQIFRVVLAQAKE